MRIRVLDLETTGEAPPEHGIVEIGWCDVTSTNANLALEPCWFEVGQPGSVLVNPGRPIPPETSAIHHLIDADVRKAPRAEDVLSRILERQLAYQKGADPIVALAAHSAKFERKFITDDMTGGLPWLCTYKCALRLWPDSPVHSNQGLRYWRDPKGLIRGIATPAHRAGPDAYVTAFHVRDLLELAPLSDLIKWSSEPALQVTCHIGKMRGLKWRDVDIGFLYWLLDKDFDEDVIFTAKTEIQRREAETPIIEEEQPEEADA